MTFLWLLRGDFGGVFGGVVPLVGEVDGDDRSLMGIIIVWAAFSTAFLCLLPLMFHITKKNLQ